VDEKQVAQYWEENAAVWTQLVRAGHDVYRDRLNTPAFLAMLPDVDGLCGLDIGCGEGHNTRIIARRGARLTGIDITSSFVDAASQREAEEPLGIRYVRASGTRLPFANEAFDFIVAFMSFMDMPGHEQLVQECSRVLKPGGFLQFSISHPAFATPRWNWIRDGGGRKVGLECGEYFREMDGELDSWMFGTAPAEITKDLPMFRIPRFTRTLSSWLNLLIDSGFRLERFAEPRLDDEQLRQYPNMYDTQIIAYFLILRCRKG
jgi:SAM-dependent methyltransferase